MVVVECGPVGTEGLHRLIAVGTEILVSVIEPGEDVLALRDDIVQAGYGPVSFVTPAGAGMRPIPDRSAA
jgi:hypothetical protein